MSRKTGSVKKGIVAPDLLEERAKCAFDQAELRTFLHGGAEREQKWSQIVDQFGADPTLRNHLGFYDMTPHEMHEDLWKRINTLYKTHKKVCFEDSFIGPPYVDWIGYF